MTGLSIIQFKTESTELNVLIAEIEAMIPLEITTFWLVDEAVQFAPQLKARFSEEIQFVHADNLKTESTESPVICYEPSAMNGFVKSGNIQIGQAYTLVDCLNWDLKNVDFIEFRQRGVKSEVREKKSLMGMESLKVLAPKEAEYGWMLMSLNTPLLLSGFAHFEELKQSLQSINAYGVCLDRHFFEKFGLIERIAEVKELL